MPTTNAVIASSTSSSTIADLTTASTFHHTLSTDQGHRSTCTTNSEPQSNVLSTKKSCLESTLNTNNSNVHSESLRHTDTATGLTPKSTTEVANFGYLHDDDGQQHAVHLSEVTPKKTSMQQSQKQLCTPKLLRMALLKEPDLKQICMKSVSTQTDLKSLQPGVAFNELADEDLNQGIHKFKRQLFKSVIFQDDENCKFYTGVTMAGFAWIYSVVGKAASRMRYWRGDNTRSDGIIPKREQKGRRRLLDIKEELLVALLRLRRGLEIEILADLMGVSASHISRVVTTWFHLLGRELVFLIKWPTRHQVQSALPKAFRFYPRTRVIIDCTEFQLQRPSLPSVQRKTFSSYKNRNTAKCLIGITPRGTISYVSDMWTGSISDKKIVEVSGFLELLEKGDDVMADRGFLIRDLVTLRKATLNIPPFANGKQLAPTAITKTRRIASLRIHVERAIGRLKQFRLLAYPIPAQLNPMLSLCVKIAAALCNLDKPLCK